jgi:hypothetical protein
MTTEEARNLLMRLLVGDPRCVSVGPHPDLVGRPGGNPRNPRSPLEQDFLIEITSCDTSLARQSALDAREEPRARAAY